MSGSLSLHGQAQMPQPSAIVEMLRPITWFPPMWAFACGVISSGQPLVTNLGILLVGMVLAGPLVCGMSQAINDWYDRHVDAINEPDRPIPSGRVPGYWGLYIAGLWSAIAVAVAATLGIWVLAATLVTLFLAWAYSAPPFRLKQNGWWGNAAVGFSYEGIAWFTGAAALAAAMPDARIIMLAVLYSIGAHGIMTLNDFKAIDGDRRMGVRSLPVQLGVTTSARLAAIVMALPQLIVIALLLAWGQPIHAAAVAVLLSAQIWAMVRFLFDTPKLIAEPVKRAAAYNGTGVLFYVSGMMVSAFAMRALLWDAPL